MAISGKRHAALKFAAFECPTSFLSTIYKRNSSIKYVINGFRVETRVREVSQRRRFSGEKRENEEKRKKNLVLIDDRELGRARGANQTDPLFSHPDSSFEISDNRWPISTARSTAAARSSWWTRFTYSLYVTFLPPPSLPLARAQWNISAVIRQVSWMKFFHPHPCTGQRPQWLLSERDARKPMADS